MELTINQVILIVLMICLAIVISLIWSESSAKTREGISTFQPIIGDENYRLKMAIDEVNVQRSGSSITVTVKVTSEESGNSQINFRIYSYPAGIVEDKTEDKIVVNGQETFTFSTTEKESGKSYYLIAEIKTIETENEPARFVTRQGKWIQGSGSQTGDTATGCNAARRPDGCPCSSDNDCATGLCIIDENGERYCMSG